jgi:hypothetical protein
LAMLSSCFQRCEKWNKPVFLMRHSVVSKSNPWKLFSRGGFYCKWATTSVPTFVKLWPRQWQVLTYRGWMIQQVHIRNISKITIMTSVTLTSASDTCREDSIAINNSGRTRKHYAQWPIRENSDNHRVGIRSLSIYRITT